MSNINLKADWYQHTQRYNHKQAKKLASITANRHTQTQRNQTQSIQIQTQTTYSHKIQIHIQTYKYHITRKENKKEMKNNEKCQSKDKNVTSYIKKKDIYQTTISYRLISKQTHQ